MVGCRACLHGDSQMARIIENDPTIAVTKGANDFDDLDDVDDDGRQPHSRRPSESCHVWGFDLDVAGRVTKPAFR